MAHSDFWMGRNWVSKMPAKASPAYLAMLGKLRRSVADFVRMVTRQDIPVEFSTTDQSYSDGKSVVISGAHSPEAVDVTVGLALHEAAHVVLSQNLFDVLKVMRIDNAVFLRQSYITPEYRALGLTDHGFLRMVMNVLEDRRIDSWMYERVGGWKAYYLALYAHYFHTPEVRKALTDPANRVESLNNYDLHITSMPSKYFDETALKLLPAVMQIVDLPNVRRFDDFNTFMKAAQDIVVLLYSDSQVDRQYVADQQPARAHRELVMGRPNTTADGQINPETAQAIKQTEDMSVTTFNQSLSENGTRQTYPVTVIDNIKTANPAVLPYAGQRGTYSSYIEAGLLRGNVLARKLRIMGEDFPIKMNRQKEGRLDRRRVAALGHEDVTVFARQHLVKSHPVHVHLTIDASSSMNGSGFGNSIAFAAMLARAAERVDSFTLEISLRSYAHGGVLVAIIYNSEKDTTRKFTGLFKELGPAGCTPEGLAFEAIRSRLEAQRPGVTHYLINLSDGFPGCDGYGGSFALNHTGQVIKRLRRQGIRVLSYLIGSSQPDEYTRTQFATMYGPSAAYVDPESIQEIARTLNRLFVVKSEN